MTSLVLAIAVYCVTVCLSGVVLPLVKSAAVLLASVAAIFIIPELIGGAIKEWAGDE